MPRELAHDVELWIQEFAPLYRPMQKINQIFQIVETKFTLEAADDTLDVALENLVEIYNEFFKE